MLKKIDKLVLKAFLGPFVLTFAVVLFIFLTQFMLKYINDLMGKGLGADVFAQLLFYFSVFLTPQCLPLAVLLACLITFGNLGEHYELTAIKSAGISLIRVMLPVFIAVVLLTLGAFYFADRVVPRANLRAFSLLYDIKTKKATLNIPEGVFYDDIPGYSIKANKKYKDGQTLGGLMIYNHTAGNGNTDVILADSGKMYTVLGERYLVLELYRGKSYSEASAQPGNYYRNDEFVRTEFNRSKMVFSLAAFDLKNTPQELFAGNHLMKTIPELNQTADSLRREVDRQTGFLATNASQNYFFHRRAFPQLRESVKPGPWVDSLQRKKLNPEEGKLLLGAAASSARNVKAAVESGRQQLENLQKDVRKFTVEKYRKYTLSVACLVMFLIGAPLGAIIRKGGLGVPVLVSIIFFIIFYVLTILGEKYAKEAVMIIPVSLWMANSILLVIGLFFLRQARNDSRILEADAYRVLVSRLKKRFTRKKEPATQPA